MQRNRHTLRLQDYDYSQEGAYFITVVTYKHVNLFGKVLKGKVELNPAGKIASEQWTQMEKRFPHSDFSSYVIMPNHIHGIVFIGIGAGGKYRMESDSIPSQRSSHISKTTPVTLGTIVRAYKASVTFRINAMRGYSSPPVWHRNYFEKIIRSEKELDDIWQYIDVNPERWEEDRLSSVLSNI